MLVNATESPGGRGRRVGEHRDADLAVVRRHAVLARVRERDRPAGALTLTTTVSLLVAPSLSVTVSRNSRVAGPGRRREARGRGVGSCQADVRANCLGPCEEAIVPSVSVEPLPFRVTLAPEATVWSAPASAVGGWFGGASTFTTTVSVSVAPASSVTVSSNVRVAGPVRRREARGRGVRSGERHSAASGLGPGVVERVACVGIGRAVPVQGHVGSRGHRLIGPASAVGGSFGTTMLVLANGTAGSSSATTPGSGPVTVPGLHPNLTCRKPWITAVILRPPVCSTTSAGADRQRVLAEVDRPARPGRPGLVVVGDAERAVGPGLITGARRAVGIADRGRDRVATVLVLCVPSTVSVPSIVVTTLAGIVFGPAVSRPRL